MGGVKTISYKQLVIELLAVKLLLHMLLTKLSDVYLNVSPCCMKKSIAEDYLLETETFVSNWRNCNFHRQ